MRLLPIVDGRFDEAQNREIERLIEIRNFWISSIYGQRILCEIVCPYGKKSQLRESTSAQIAAEGTSIMMPVSIFGS